MEHALVTGGAGFLGSHLCDLLLSRGCRVTAVDSLITGSLENISHNLANPNFKFIRHDISEHIGVGSRVDAVYHLASPASPIDYRQLPIQTLKAGSLGTHNALGLAKAHGARFLMASTSEVYGDPQVHPQTEDYWGNVNPIGPRSVYDEAKRFSEALTMAYHTQHGLRTHIVRIFNTYGPRMRMNDGRVVPEIITQALSGRPLTVFGDGSQTRSFCYVADEIDGLRRLMDTDCVDPINVGNPAEMTVLQFTELVRRLTECRSEIVFMPLPKDDPTRRRPDIAKARRILDWEPKVDIEDGLRETIAYFKSRL